MKEKFTLLKKKQSSIALRSDPIYGINFGFYYIKLYLAEDKKGERVIESLKQSIKLYGGKNKGRDYATQYTILEDKKEIKKLITIFPNKRKGNKLISAGIPEEYKMAYAAVNFDRSTIEYVPKKENIYNWSKIITIIENKHINNDISKPHIHALVRGNSMYNKFFKKDKDFQITYTAIRNGKFINVESPNFRSLVKKANEVMAYIDYHDHRTPRSKKRPYEREYLVTKSIQSDVSVWEFQCTVRYDERWSKKKIESTKEEAVSIVSNMQYVKLNPIDNIHKIATATDIDNFRVESQRLDDRDLNKKFKHVGKYSDKKKKK